MRSVGRREVRGIGGMDGGDGERGGEAMGIVPGEYWRMDCWWEGLWWMVNNDEDRGKVW